MHNVRFIRHRFPQQQDRIIRILVLISGGVLAVGAGLLLVFG